MGRRAPHWFLIVAVFFSISGNAQEPGDSRSSEDPTPVSALATLGLKFEFRPEKIREKTLYHYVKSNQDGTRSSSLYLYVESREQITAFKPDKGSPDSAYITAIMDWGMFCPKRLEARRVDRMGKRRELGQVEFNWDQKKKTVAVEGFGKPLVIPDSGLPVHSWDFDFASLNFSLRHLKKPEDGLTIGIADLDYRASAPGFVYRGQVVLDYLKREERHGIPCRKYSIDGPGLENRGGFAWVSLADEHVVEFEIGFPDEPGYNDVRIRLVEVKTMTSAEWEQLLVDEQNK